MFKSVKKSIRKKALSLLAFVLLLFVWFEIRPMITRMYCNKQATQSEQVYTTLYSQCVHSFGIRS